MKNLLLPIFAVFVLFSCDKDDVTLTLEQQLTANTWSVVVIKAKVDGVTESNVIGEPIIQSYTNTFYCSDGSYKDIKVDETLLTEYLYLTYNTNKAYSSIGKSSSKHVNFSASTCENIVFNENLYLFDSDTDADIISSTWELNEATSTLTLISVYKSFDDQEITEIDDYAVKIQNGGLELFLDNNDLQLTITAVPKK